MIASGESRGAEEEAGSLLHGYSPCRISFCKSLSRSSQVSGSARRTGSTCGFGSAEMLSLEPKMHKSEAARPTERENVASKAHLDHFHVTAVTHTSDYEEINGPNRAENPIHYWYPRMSLRYCLP